MFNRFYEECTGNRIEVDIPDGFRYKTGSVNKGIVIVDEDGNEFTRVPTGYNTRGLYVKGFWISRYEISTYKYESPITPRYGSPKSMPGQNPVTYINYYQALELAYKFGGDLPTGNEYDRLCTWIAESRSSSFQSVFLEGSPNRGNYVLNYGRFKISKTGKDPRWMVNNIDNFFGNAYIWTKEKSELYDGFRLVRSGPYTFPNGVFYPPAYAMPSNTEKGENDTTFRIVIHDDIELEED